MHARVPVEKVKKCTQEEAHHQTHYSSVTETRDAVCLMLVLSSTKLPAEHKLQLSVMDSGICMIFSNTNGQVLFLILDFSGFALALFSSTEICALSNQ